MIALITACSFRGFVKTTSNTLKSAYKEGSFAMVSSSIPDTPIKTAWWKFYSEIAFLIYFVDWMPSIIGILISEITSEMGFYD